MIFTSLLESAETDAAATRSRVGRALLLDGLVLADARRLLLDLSAHDVLHELALGLPAGPAALGVGTEVIGQAGLVHDILLDVILFTTEANTKQEFIHILNFMLYISV